MTESGSPEIVLEAIVEATPFAKLDGILRYAPGARPSTVVLQTHPRRDTFTNLTAWPMCHLPQRRIATFAFSNRATNSAAGVDVSTLWEPLALDVAAAVHAMRARGFENVIVYGTSAGGPLMAFYQNVAENGMRALDAARPLSEFSGYAAADGSELRLPPADAVILQNATAGPGASFLDRLDGSIVDEAMAVREPSLDMFDPANGFDPETGAATYSPEFLRRYARAQARRMNRLIAAGRARLADMARTGLPYLDDAFVVIPGIRACPAFVDLSLTHMTEAAWPTRDGIKRVTSDRPVVPGAGAANRMREQGTTVHSLSSFLSYRAVECEDDDYVPDAVRRSETGIREESSHTSTASNIAGVAAPLLVTQGTADIEVRLPTSELILNSATSSQLEAYYVLGATHAMQNVVAPDTYDSCREEHVRVVADWISRTTG